MNMTSIYLAGATLLTPLGADPMTVRAAMEAGLSGYQYCNLLGEGEPPIQFSPVPDEALKVRIPAQLPGFSPPQIRLRSEERRVGKECVSRWWAEHCKREKGRGASRAE